MPGVYARFRARHVIHDSKKDTWWNFFINTYQEHKAKDQLRKLKLRIDSIQQRNNKLDIELLETIERLKKFDPEVDNFKSGRIIQNFDNSEISICFNCTSLNYLILVILTISLVIRALYKIKTSFKTLEKFLKIQKIECESLLKLNEETDGKLRNLQEKNEVIHQKHPTSLIYETTIRWMALFKINHDAYMSIEVFSKSKTSE